MRAGAINFVVTFLLSDQA